MSTSLASIARRTMALGALVALFAGCRNMTAPSNGIVTASTDRASYARGTTGTVSFRNVSGHEVLFNVCLHELQRREGLIWTNASDFPPPPAACTAEANGLPSGATTTTTFAVPATVSPGTYRLRYEGVADGVITPTFEVVAKP